MSKAMFDGSSPGSAKLLEAVPVLPAAVVSKPLVNTESCKVIVFALDAGQSIKEHRAPYATSVHVLDGRMTLSVAGTLHELAPNDWLLMPRDTPHDVSALEPTRFLLTLMR